ncbi:MAG: hypothetical protein CL851_05415 [Crocinitomicaceae bacterium]|nr:hypothetical protein [Crocinitomicaceae bacterium]
MTNINLDGVSLIIGGSSSLGEITCNEFTKNGCHVVTTYTKKIIPKQPLIETYHLDLSLSESIRSFVLKIRNHKMVIKNVILLSSILPGKSLEDYNQEELNQVIKINFLGQVELIKLIIKLMDNKTNILMMSSISGRRGSFDPVYAASKGAIITFVKSMVKQIPQGARINAIAPSLIENSKMFFDMKKERRNQHVLDSPSGELINLNDLAKILFDLCQPHWRHINGTCIDINGGVYV